MVKTTITDHHSTFVNFPFVVNASSIKKLLTDEDQKLKFVSGLKALITEEEILASNVQDGTKTILGKHYLRIRQLHERI